MLLLWLHVMGELLLAFTFNFKVNDIFDSQWQTKQLDFMSILFAVSLENILMPTSIFGEMVLLIGKKKNGFGNLNSKKNRQKSCPRIKSVKPNPLRK